MKKAGISAYKIFPASEIVFDSEVRKICEKNTCRLYGKSWACHPAVGSVDDCRELCSRYENATLFGSVYNLTEPFDYEGMVSGHRQFKKNCDSLFEMLVGKSRNFLLLSNEGCNRCESCTYPENKCRMPEKLFPSVEGFGINVVALASKVGLKYNNGENTVTYFGMLMF